MKGTSLLARAFTILEVIIALTLVLAIAAIGWVSLAPLKTSVEFDEACAAIASGIDTARARAAARGEVLEVRAAILPGSVEIQTRALAPAGSARDGSARDGSARDGSARDGSARDGSARDGYAASGVDGETQVYERDRAWFVVARVSGEALARTFAGGPGFADERASSKENVNGLAEESARESSPDSLAGGAISKRAPDPTVQTVDVGIAMPDGSMMAVVPLRLQDSAERWATIRIGTWTTRVERESVASTTEGDPVQERETNQDDYEPSDASEPNQESSKSDVNGTQRIEQDVYNKQSSSVARDAGPVSLFERVGRHDNRVRGVGLIALRYEIA